MGMEPERFASAVIRNIPYWLDQTYIEEWVRFMPDIVQVRRSSTGFSGHGHYDLIFDFKPGVDTFLSMGVLPEQPNIVTIDHQKFWIIPFSATHYLTGLVVVSKIEFLHHPINLGDTTVYSGLMLDKLAPVQAECYVCRDQLVAPFSTPCLSCDRADCYECIRKHFRVALNDFERFPARCCGMAWHPDVAKGILPEAELLKYRARFEEWIAKRPFYCPVPTCSTFIPSRRFRGIEDETIECDTCQTSICVTCKQLAHVGQSCWEGKSKNEDLKWLRMHGCRLCPRCGTAVGKTDGCAHIQCNCGTHWCWDCGRKIDECNMSACNELPSNDYHENDDDDEDDADDEDEDDAEDEDSSGDPSNNDSDTDLDDENLVDMAAANQSESNELENTETGDLLMADSNLHTAQLVNNSDQNNVEQKNSVDTPVPIIAENHTSGASAATIPVPDVSNIASSHLELQPGNCSYSINPPAPQQPVLQPNIPSDTQATRSEQPRSVNLNLDDFHSSAGEDTDLDFNYEHPDGYSPDIWGCNHRFRPAGHYKVPRFWMTASVPDWWDREPHQREVTCMVCSHQIKLVPTPEETKQLAECVEREKRIISWTVARRCYSCNVIVCGKCAMDMVNDDD